MNGLKRKKKQVSGTSFFYKFLGCEINNQACSGRVMFFVNY